MKEIRFRCSGLPGGPDSPAEFIEAEDETGRGLGTADGLEWVQDGDTAYLRFRLDRDKELAELHAAVENLCNRCEALQSQLDIAQDALRKHRLEKHEKKEGD